MPAPTTAPAPTGTLVVAVTDVGPATGYRPRDMAWPYNNRHLLFGVYESALRYEKDFKLSPFVASAWDLKPDAVTLTVRPGVKFHDPAAGEVTAHDLVFTFEDGRLEGNKKLGEVINPFYGAITATDDRTVRMELKQQHVRWISTLTKLLDGNAPISSKKLFDSLGPDKYNLTPNGTGPFKIVEQVSDDHITLEAVVPHWRQTAGFARVNYLEIPEQAAQIAALKVGEADIIPVTLSVLDQVKPIQGVQLVEGLQRTGSGGVNVFLAGQYYTKTKKDGTPTGFVPATERPWVGNPDDPASMEKARKVRLAMAMAVDREGIIDTILAGRGCPAYVLWMDSCHPRWQAKWEVPFDPAKAKQTLAEAGYPQGFEFPLFIPSDSGAVLDEVGVALLPMFEQIGLRAKVEKAAYSAKRPLMLSRKFSDAWVWNHSDAGIPLGFVSSWGFFTAATVWTPGYQIPWIEEYYDRLGATLDETKQWEIITEWMERTHQEMPSVQIASFVNPWAVSPRVQGWVYPYQTGFWPDDLFTARPAR